MEILIKKDELKELYKECLKTEKGKECLKIAINYMKEWKKGSSDMNFCTKNIIENDIPKLLKDKISKIEIINIGLNNFCHINSEIFKKANYEIILGFNLTACPCGKLICFEIHSINKKDGILYDFTRDFNNEKEKYFLELKTKLSWYHYLKLYGNNLIVVNKGCKCNVQWNYNGNYIDENKLLQLIKSIESY